MGKGKDGLKSFFFLFSFFYSSIIINFDKVQRYE